MRIEPSDCQMTVSLRFAGVWTKWCHEIQVESWKASFVAASARRVSCLRRAPPNRALLIQVRSDIRENQGFERMTR